MPLIEVVHGAATDAAAVQLATGFARRLDKLPLPCRSAPGFMVNRVLTPYMYEAMLAAGEGVPLAVDRPGRGRLRHADGTDRAHRRRRARRREPRGRDHRARASAPGDAGPAPRPSSSPRRSSVARAARASTAGRTASRSSRAARAPAAPADLIDRLILVLVNECVACLRERVVERCRPGRCRGDLRHRFRAVSWRTSHLCARARGGGGRGATAGTRGALRRTFSAGCGLGAARGAGKSVTGVRRT